MNIKEIYLAGGCFWGTEKAFQLLNGVTDTEVGYANGTLDDPTYKDVCTDTTGHRETVKVVCALTLLSKTDRDMTSAVSTRQVSIIQTKRTGNLLKEYLKRKRRNMISSTWN